MLTRLADNTGLKKSPKIRHLRTIAQLRRAICSQLRHLSTIGKHVKHQYLTHMPLQYGLLRPTIGRLDRLVSLGHQGLFQRVSSSGSVTARHSSTVGVSQNFRR